MAGGGGGHGGDEFEGGAGGDGGEGAVDAGFGGGAVDPVDGVDVLWWDEDIGVVGRQGDHGEDLAGVDVHDDGGAAADLGFAHGIFRDDLGAGVDGEVDIAAGERVTAEGFDFLGEAAVFVFEPDPFAGFAAEDIVFGFFDACLADVIGFEEVP